MGMWGGDLVGIGPTHSLTVRAVIRIVVTLRWESGKEFKVKIITWSDLKLCFYFSLTGLSMFVAQKHDGEMVKFEITTRQAQFKWRREIGSR